MNGKYEHIAEKDSETMLKEERIKTSWISKQQWCCCDTEVQAAIMQTTICIILCVVIRMTASSDSYLRATCFPHVQLACAHHRAGQVASPSPVITVSTSLHVTPRMPYTSTYTYKCKCVRLLTRTKVDSTDSWDWFGAVPLQDIEKLAELPPLTPGLTFRTGRQMRRK